MNQYLKQCIALMLVLPAIYLAWFYTGNQDVTDLVLEAVLVYCMVPMTCPPMTVTVSPNTMDCGGS